MKKILLLLVLAFSFVSCSQENCLEQTTVPTTRSVPMGVFTDLEEYSGNMYKEISAIITCSEASTVTFTIALNYPSSSRFSAYYWIGNASYGLNQSKIQDVTVNLPKGTSSVSIRLSQGNVSSFGGYARMFIKEVNSGAVTGYSGGYDDLTVQM